MNDLWVKIIRVDNGYIVEKEVYLDLEEGKGETIINKEVFEDTDDELGYVDSLCNTLWAVVDEVGVSTSRYDKKRIKVLIESGDKCEV